MSSHFPHYLFIYLLITGHKMGFSQKSPARDDKSCCFIGQGEVMYLYMDIKKP